ncbi:hypothetical protein Y1Q_0013982 [Alligator mississippiensis]|uniref:Uncharacterized protein n=1 Tax=Alligator mississippiensis TaxID=8496 RepID=A0A151PDS2_ALLMI|nr:hypothetical protein Y1Q_0013982 [Alligator mississippiensis]
MWLINAFCMYTAAACMGPGAQPGSLESCVQLNDMPHWDYYDLPGSSSYSDFYFVGSCILATGFPEAPSCAPGL